VKVIRELLSSIEIYANSSEDLAVAHDAELLLFGAFFTRHAMATRQEQNLDFKEFTSLARLLRLQSSVFFP